MDLTRNDRHLGSNAEMQSLIAAAHARGMKVSLDDRDYAGTGTFPALDPATSFPYVPTFETPAETTVVKPKFLDDPIDYHNRGDSTLSGKRSS